MKSPLLIAFVVSLAATTAYGQTDEAGESLRGLEGVRVVVEALPTLAQRVGLQRSALQEDTERSLQESGIAVLDTDMVESPYLYVRVDILNVPPEPMTTSTRSRSILNCTNLPVSNQAGRASL